MRTDEGTYTDQDGIAVFHRRWLPDGDPSGVVLVLHGMSEHSGRYARFAEALVAQGLAVYADDHRGFGKTAASTGVGATGPRGFDGVLDAIRTMHELATTEHGDVPVVVFGHSMGSVFAQAYVQRHHDVAGLVLSGGLGPAPELADMVAGIQAIVDAGAGDEPLPILGGFNEAFEPARTGYDWLSRDDAEVDAYLADPMCGEGNPPTARFVAGMLGLLHEVATAEAIAGVPASIPVLLVTGDADPVSNGGESVRVLEDWYRDAGHEVTAHYYPGARHEVLNETNRDEVTADIVRTVATWLDA